MDPFILLAAVLGLLVGSFTNVLAYRIPAGRSVVHPPSACPTCARRLSPAELIPVLSWAVQRGRCRGCQQRISVRYPLVELTSAGLYAGIATLFPLAAVGTDGLPGLALLFAAATLLLTVTLIDLDTKTIPDGVNFTLLGLLLLGGYALPALGLPSPLLPWAHTVSGAVLACGAMALLALYAALLLRRGRERLDPSVPLGYVHVALGALVGGIGALIAQPGLALPSAALVSAAVPVVALLRGRAHLTPLLPERVILGLLPVALLSAARWGRAGDALTGILTGAGTAALICGLVWWFLDRRAAAAAARGEDAAPDTAAHDPEGFGFGDVKFAAVMGALLGGPGFLVAVLLAVMSGAAFGVFRLIILRRAGHVTRDAREIPFGPWLVLGTLLSFLWGQPILNWYLTLLGAGA
ncbi:prepilin peptidase [Deinococcus soli (ex Cha et al. 2016)]|uniref:Leader peptidase (Prepilin peptidase)/N-methyltransferase n=2 Tax=Deinococcus soli (ex Cha et al. 2016) TaxID=1309411 RepID=A0AAE3XD43_9DEIO|nr:prepilin peptidase [Deinococcus soli (ex Cha et al. 2016)]MDR6218297.1 leader peptidase (prepilin peptidase)/N-methyltransferase [Deinococcus soli (ex Cha et al. 2016)]MDR6329037.1 leader peptidase (prepilin peptidase)/N-methyltransferase [Deinococcus soli (ex Cha et al. 2016)]MDR6751310.1 leader peptidase (prepilin peptidase)/N-methyltransferase [Deinococcus soli (ex Cha et al. 2016)]